MKNIFEVARFTLREALAKKVFIFYLGFSVISLLILGLVLGLTDIQQMVDLTGENEAMLEKFTHGLQMMVSGTLGTLLIFLAVFSSANFISSMLEKGTADLFLSKPLSRDQLIWGKFIGGIAVFIINILLPVIGSWIIISLKFQYMNLNFFWIIVTYTFVFTVLYSIVILLGILTRSSFPGIMTAYFIFVILSQLLHLGYNNIEQITQNEIVQYLITGLYYIIPKTSEILGDITNNLITGLEIENYQPVITSFLFLFFMMVLSIYFFRKKDF
jgi:ABC-type transport system involved in multi-copper enzyme maturation permease subunit